MSSFPTRATLAGSPSKATAQAWFLSLADFVAQRLAAGTTGAGTATSAELALARASLQVGSQGLKNRIINASGLVQQRSAPTLSASYQYGVADRMMVAAISGSGFAGTVGVLANAGFTSGVGYGAVSASWTGGQIAIQQRLESKDVADLNGKTITVSCKVYHDFGTSRNFQIRVQKPTALDNHTSATILGNSAGIPVASGVVTTISFQLTLGSTDATNGLAVLVFDGGTATVSSKNAVIGDLQLEEGAAATALDIRPYALEYALCSRFYQGVYAGFRTYAGAANTHALNINFPVLMRTTPSITLAGSISSANAGSEAVFGANAAQTRWSFASLASGDSYILERLLILNAEL